MSWEKLNAEQKQEWLDKAQKYIYPGLEPAFKQHDKMLETLGRAFYRIDRLGKDGTI